MKENKMNGSGSAATGNRLIQIIVMAVSALLVFILVMTDALYSPDAFLTDKLYTKLTGPDSRIIIIGVDEETLAEYGNFTLWSREKTAELLTMLYSDPDNAPAVTGLDLLFTEPYDAQTDQALADAASLAQGSIVAGSHIVYRGQVEKTADGKMYYNTEHIDALEMPVDELAAHTTAGFTNACIAKDGYVRYAMNTIKTPDGGTQDSFAYAVYKMFSEGKGDQIYVPVTQSNGLFQFMYSGKSGEYSKVSFRAVLAGEVPMSAFKDAIVLVGAYAPGMQDSYQPASDRDVAMYGVENHANIVQAYMQHKTMTGINRVVAAIIAALIIVLFIALSDKAGLWPGLIGSVVVGALYTIIGRVLAAHGHFIPLIYVLLFLIIADAYLIVGKYVIEKIRRRHTLDVFKKYVAPQVVDELSRSGDFQLTLGGEKRNIAVLFIDIRGFTTMSESLDPVQVVEILNDYLALVTDCVLSNGGTLDKFIGDAAMAVFNAPFDMDDYVYKAVKTAWDINSRSKPLEESLFERFGKGVKFGIGVNCGDAVVGNIGCDFRMDYTAIGDTVNTAARLEANAGAGEIYISEEVYDILGERVKADLVGDIPLKGKSNKINVYSVKDLEV